MAGYRGIFIKGLRQLGVALPTSFLVKLTGQNFIFPYYHTISDTPLDHIRHLYPVKGVRAFEKDLDFLLRHYRPVGLDELISLVQNRCKPREKAFLLSFDDGLKEFYDVIAPVLLRKGIPAACFLNSDFVDNKALFYRYKASLLIDAISKRPQLAQQLDSLTPNYRQKLLAISYRQRHLLDEMAQKAGVDFEQYLAEKQPYLSSSQIETLIGQGFFFGAHSCDHPEYRLLSLEEQLEQTRKSAAWVTGRFQLPYRTFSFPFTDYGVKEEFFKTVFEKENILDISFGCAGLKKDTHPQHVQRIPLEMAGLNAREILHSEYLYFLLKAPLGRNIVKRA